MGGADQLGEFLGLHVEPNRERGPELDDRQAASGGLLSAIPPP